MERKNPTQIAIMAGVFVGLGVLLALATRWRFLAGFVGGSTVAGYGGLAVTFLIYLGPTIAAIVVQEPAPASRIPNAS